MDFSLYILTFQHFGISNILFSKEKKCFIQHGHIKLIKSDCKNLYNVTNCGSIVVLLTFYSSENPNNKY